MGMVDFIASSSSSNRLFLTSQASKHAISLAANLLAIVTPTALIITPPIA